MTPRRVQHCGDAEPHEPHVGRWTHHLMQGGPYCDGTPELLARQLEREANPPPGPPSPPKPVEWTAPRGLCDEPTEVTARNAVMGDIDVEPGLIGDHTTHWPECWRYHHECSTAEIVRLRSVVAGVEALADEWERNARIWIARGPGTDYDIGRHVIASLRRLRSVLSDTKGDAQ